MLEVIFLAVLALIWIVFATVQDLKKREVADWLNFSLIIFALGFRFFWSLFSESGFGFFYQGLIGFGIFFVVGNLFYYGKMFAGGDAKLMIALGAILPFSTVFSENVKIFVLFFVLFLFAGAIYSIFSSVYLSLTNFKKFGKEFSKQIFKNKKLISFIIIFAIVSVALGFVDKIFFMFGVLVFLAPYFYFYVKAVDEACMVKKVNAKDLAEGDWLYKDVKVGKKTLRANWDGLSKKDIALLKKNKKKILIRQGIPFTPVFLISFLVLLFFFSKGLWNPFW